MDTENFVDDWWSHHNDKTLTVLSNSESEYKVTYKNDAGNKFSVIFKPKKYEAGFHKKWQ